MGLSKAEVVEMFEAAKKNGVFLQEVKHYVTGTLFCPGPVVFQFFHVVRFQH